MARELMVVIPVFNEEQCIESVLREWTAELDRSVIDYSVLLLDDGSTDGTAALLMAWKSRNPERCIEIVRHANRGHGQTCLEGYRIACQRGIPWVLQIDSDGQCDPLFFAKLWSKRKDFDVVYGQRTDRRDGWKRVLASILVKIAVRMASGERCADANVPYRLMRTQNLRPLVDSIPVDFDLANIALAVQVNRARWREALVPITFRSRSGGEPSVPFTRFAGKALELLAQLKSLPQCDVVRF